MTTVPGVTQPSGCESDRFWLNHTADQTLFTRPDRFLIAFLGTDQNDLQTDQKNPITPAFSRSDTWPGTPLTGGFTPKAEQTRRTANREARR